MKNIRMYLKNNKKTGFTLIELIIAISIVAILALLALSVINITRQRQRAQDAIAQDEMEEVVTAINTYKITEGTYPTDLQDLVDKEYLKEYPVVDAGEIQYSYDYCVSSGGVSVQMPSNGTGYFKYNSGLGEISRCQEADPCNTQCTEPPITPPDDSPDSGTPDDGNGSDDPDDGNGNDDPDNDSGVITCTHNSDCVNLDCSDAGPGRWAKFCDRTINECICLPLVQ